MSTNLIVALISQIKATEDLDDGVEWDLLRGARCAGDQVERLIDAARTKRGTIALKADVAGNLWVEGNVGKDLRVEGNVAEDLWVAGDVAGNLSVLGQVLGNLWMQGLIEGHSTLTPSGQSLLRVASMRRARFEKPVFIGERVSISDYDFRQCSDLDKLDLVSGDLFAPVGGDERRAPPNELANPPASSDEMAPWQEMASINRQLRSNLEARNNRPAARILYRGEMNARRRAAKDAGDLTDRFLLALCWVVSGYGLSISVPIVWFAFVALFGTGLFMVAGVSTPLPQGDVAELQGCMEYLTFTVRSMLSFFNPPPAELTLPGQWLQIFLRFLGPLFAAQAILATRDRVAR